MKKKATKKKATRRPRRHPTVRKTARKKASREKSPASRRNWGRGCRRSNKSVIRPEAVQDGRVVIGDMAVELRYTGGQGKRGFDGIWVHKFDSPVVVIGNADGSVTLKSKKGLRLWDYYEYEE